MGKRKKATAKKDDVLEIVTFKVSRSMYDELKRYGESQRDDAGVSLSVGLAARRLVSESLKRLKK